MAEIEIAILERNALSRRLQDEAALHCQVSAVESERNAQQRGISWQFPACDARVKLERLAPVKERASDEERDLSMFPVSHTSRQIEASLVKTSKAKRTSSWRYQKSKCFARTWEAKGDRHPISKLAV